MSDERKTTDLLEVTAGRGLDCGQRATDEECHDAYAPWDHGVHKYILITTISRRYAYNLRCVVLLTNLTYKPSNTSNTS